MPFAHSLKRHPLVKPKNQVDTRFFETEKIWKILLRLAPPIMFAQLIQALYNIVDSYFVGRYSEAGLTALSIIYPVQLLISALGIGTGVGMNTMMAKYYGENQPDQARKIAGAGILLAVVNWVVFALLTYFALEPYIFRSVQSAEVGDYALVYGNWVCFFSLGIFLESIWTKTLQARGNMRLPMIAQVVGAGVNMALDPLLIFGYGGFPAMGIAGAAIATLVGQFLAAIITGVAAFVPPIAPKKAPVYIRQIYKAGLPSILLQIMFTIYIVGLNLVLVGFSDAAVTVLGLYYKVQTFFLIPMMGLQTCIVPILSYNYAVRRPDRCQEVLRESVIISLVFMSIGLISFELIPEKLLGIFTHDAAVLGIGETAFRIIAISFVPIVYSMLFSVFFQAIGKSRESILLVLLRHVVLFVPVAWLLSFINLTAVWVTFPITETLTSLLGIHFYREFERRECRGPFTSSSQKASV